MTRNDRAIAAVSAVLRGHRWPDAVVAERARQCVHVANALRDLGWEYTEYEARQTLVAVRRPIYGAVPVTDDECDSLAARVVLALGCVE